MNRNRSTNRRNFLAASAGVLAGELFTGCASNKPFSNPRTSSTRQQKRPNVLLILADDLGYGDLCSFGAHDIQSPNIDRIAAEGMRFTNFYANCPVCSPTRASLLSGRFPAMVGVPGVVRTFPHQSWGHLTSDSLLLPEILKRAGYHTSIIGKWHLGLNSPNTPNERGFDVFRGFLGDMMDDYYTHRRHDINYMRTNSETIDPKGHATDLFSDWACDELKQRSPDQPFFMYLAYNAPHTPIQPPEEWVERVKSRQPGIDPERAKLVALIEHMDAGIGLVLDTLRAQGLEENTIVIFTSDNGGLVRVGANNGGLREGKTTVYEGGIRVPMAACWPNRIPAGTASDRVALTMDMLPTILEAAGVGFSHEIDGSSILPTLLGKSQPEEKRDLFWNWLEGGGPEGGGATGWTTEAIRRGDWKLLKPKGGSLELYNLHDDPKEMRDLAKIETEKFEELRDALNTQLEKYHQVPWKPPERIARGL